MGRGFSAVSSILLESTGSTGSYWDETGQLPFLSGSSWAIVLLSARWSCPNAGVEPHAASSMSCPVSTADASRSMVSTVGGLGVSKRSVIRYRFARLIGCVRFSMRPDCSFGFHAAGRTFP